MFLFLKHVQQFFSHRQGNYESVTYMDLSVKEVILRGPSTQGIPK